MSQSYSRKKIIDAFTDLPYSRSYKWQLRHPERWRKAHNERRRRARQAKKEGANDDRQVQS